MLKKHQDIDPQETQEWIESIEDALEEHGHERTRFLLETLIDYAQTKGARLPFNTTTPFLNTILPEQQPEYPGDRDLERKIKTIYIQVLIQLLEQDQMGQLYIIELQKKQTKS